MLKSLFAFAFISFAAFAADIPGGLSRTSEGLPNNTYELLLAPSYTFKPAGAFLSAEVRYQPNEDFGAGIGFGAGEIGANFGLNGTWYILPDLGDQPAFSILGGLFLNRLRRETEDVTESYFNVRVAPMVSKKFGMAWGKVTPYAGLHMTPSFRLQTPDNRFSMKSALGAQFDIKALNGLLIFTEVDLGLVESVHQFSVAVSYPFVAL